MTDAARGAYYAISAHVACASIFATIIFHDPVLPHTNTHTGRGRMPPWHDRRFMDLVR